MASQVHHTVWAQAEARQVSTSRAAGRGFHTGRAGQRARLSGSCLLGQALLLEVSHHEFRGFKHTHLLSPGSCGAAVQAWARGSGSGSHSWHWEVAWSHLNQMPSRAGPLARPLNVGGLHSLLVA